MTRIIHTHDPESQIIVFSDMYPNTKYLLCTECGSDACLRDCYDEHADHFGCHNQRCPLHIGDICLYRSRLYPLEAYDELKAGEERRRKERRGRREREERSRSRFRSRSGSVPPKCLTPTPACSPPPPPPPGTWYRSPSADRERSRRHSSQTRPAGHGHHTRREPSRPGYRNPPAQGRYRSPSRPRTANRTRQTTADWAAKRDASRADGDADMDYLAARFSHNIRGAHGSSPQSPPHRPCDYPGPQYSGPRPGPRGDARPGPSRQYVYVCTEDPDGEILDEA